MNMLLFVGLTTRSIQVSAFALKAMRPNVEYQLKGRLSMGCPSFTFVLIVFSAFCVIGVLLAGSCSDDD